MPLPARLTSRLGLAASAGLLAVAGLPTSAAAVSAVGGVAAQVGQYGAAHTVSTEGGRLVVRQQLVRGVPVLGGSVATLVTRSGRVRRKTHPTPRPAPLTPSVTPSAAAARRTAISVTARAEVAPASSLVAT